MKFALSVEAGGIVKRLPIESFGVCCLYRHYWASLGNDAPSGTMYVCFLGFYVRESSILIS